MTKITELTKNVDTRPFYALVGATDLTVEKAREAADAAEDFGAQMRAEFDKIVADLATAKVQDRAEAAIAEVKDLPHQAAVTRKASMEKWAARYEDLATRGKKLVERIRGQKATQDLMAQADATMATAKGAMTTATKAAKDVERSAKATITTGRNQATKAAEAIRDSVVEEVKFAEAEVAHAVKATRTAAKRTSTTTRNAAKKTASATKGARTSAAKTAAAAEKATAKAAEKVGD